MEKVKKLILIMTLSLVLTGCGAKDINQEIAKLKEELANTQKEVEDFNTEDLIKQVKSRNEKIETLEKELTTAKQQIEQLSNDNNTKNNSTENLKMTITDNNKKIEELTQNNLALANKVSSLEATNKKIEELTQNNLALTNKVSSLEATNKTLNSTISYIKNNQSSNSKYTITKEQLVGKWQKKDGNTVYEFTENSEVIDNNWAILEIIYEDKDQSTYGTPYLYKDEILYVPDGVLVKID